MYLPSNRRFRSALAGLVAFHLAAILCIRFVQARDDRDLDSSLLALTDCPTEPGCPALILLDDTDVSNDSQRAKASYRRVVKVFTEEGIQRYSDVEIAEDVGSLYVRNLSGRTILPDGKSLKLSQDNVFVKTVYKRGRQRIRVKTAKFPGVVPGAIIDYTFDRVSPGAANFVDWRWDVQQDVPVVESRLRLRRGEMPLQWIQAGTQKVEIEHRAPYPYVDYFTARDVPSIPDVPFGPPVDAMRCRVYFHSPAEKSLWLLTFSSAVGHSMNTFLQGGEIVQETLDKIVAPRDGPSDKIRKIYRFVQEDLGAEEKRAEQTEADGLTDAKTVGDVLRRGYGNEFQRTLVFAALAKAAGLQHGLLVVSARDNTVLDPELPDLDQFDTFAAAVRSAQGWTFYDPAVRHCPFGMLAPEKEGGGINAMLITPTGGFSLASVPFSAAIKNATSRTADVTIDADGSARIVVQEVAQGLEGYDRRRRYAHLDEEARRTSIRAELAEALPKADLQAVEFRKLEEYDEPVVLEYTLAVPALAPTAGGRVVLAPSIFGAGLPAVFRDETREVPVHFPHTRRVRDVIKFHLPEGYAVEKLPVGVIERDGPFMLATRYAVEEGALLFERTIEVGAAIWPTEEYGRLKKFFDMVHESDKQAVLIGKASP